MQSKNTQNAMMFEVGNTYVMGWIGDSELKTPFIVVKRTKCFVTLQDVRTGETVRCKTYFYNGVESCQPTGNYSMAPILRADKLQAEPTPAKPEVVEHKGFKIVPSNKIDGWFMTECGTVCGESIDEVKFDIDNADKYAEIMAMEKAEMAAREMIDAIQSKRLAPIIPLFK